MSWQKTWNNSEVPTLFADNVVPSNDVCVTLVELSVAVFIHLHVIVLQYMPLLNTQRQNFELSSQSIAIINPTFKGISQ